ERLDHAPHRRELRLEIVGRLLAVGLVLAVHRVAKRHRARVEDHRQVRRPVLELELDQHRGEAVDRARRHAGARRQRRQRVIGAKDETGSVDQVERVIGHRARRLAQLIGPFTMFGGTRKNTSRGVPRFTVAPVPLGTPLTWSCARKNCGELVSITVVFIFGTTSKQICLPPEIPGNVSSTVSEPGVAFGPVKLSCSGAGGVVMHTVAGPMPLRFGTSSSMKLSTVIGSTSTASTWISNLRPLASATMPETTASLTPLPVASSKVNESGQRPAPLVVSPAPFWPVQHCVTAQPAGRVPAGPKSAGDTTAPVAVAVASPRVLGSPVWPPPMPAS